MVTFTKLRDGTWGLRGPAADLYPGRVVSVGKRDGTTTQVAVGRIVWSGDGIALATSASLNAVASYVGIGRRRGGCGCDCGECAPCCSCDAHCVCRGGNIYDC